MLVSLFCRGASRSASTKKGMNTGNPGEPKRLTSWNMKAVVHVIKWTGRHRALAGRVSALIFLLLAGGGLVAYAQTGGGHDLTRGTVDSSGAANLSGGDYTLSGTTGQPKAITTALSGDDYMLMGGIWPSAVPKCPIAPSISFTPTHPQPNEQVDFGGTIAGGSGVITFTWRFGDGTGEFQGQSLDHTYALNGEYTVVLTATGSASCSPPPSTVTATAGITVGFGTPAALVYLPILLNDYTEIVFPTGSEPPELVSTQAPPAQVTGLWGHVDPAGGSTRLTWTPNLPEDAVSGYRVYRRGQTGEDAFHLLGTVPASAATYTDPAAACGQMYFVTAFNAAGESPASTASFFSPPCR